jgi:hypothetical protein
MVDKDMKILIPMFKIQTMTNQIGPKGLDSHNVTNKIESQHEEISIFSV